MSAGRVEVRTIRRGEGQSAIAASAYRSGTVMLEPVREGGAKVGEEAIRHAAYMAGGRLRGATTRHDFSLKEGVECSFMVVPPGCDWARDPQRLWIAADRAEKHPKAWLARELLCCFPHEFTAEMRREQAESFAREDVVGVHGCAAQVSIHRPSGHGDQRNEHVHILTTVRACTPSGMGKKLRHLDVSTTSGEHIERWRERWVARCNDGLRSLGLEGNLDHRSYERQAVAQGLDPADAKLPGVHLGPRAAKVERDAKARGQGPKTAGGRFNAAKDRWNAGERTVEVVEVLAAYLSSTLASSRTVRLATAQRVLAVGRVLVAWGEAEPIAARAKTESRLGYTARSRAPLPSASVPLRARAKDRLAQLAGRGTVSREGRAADAVAEHNAKLAVGSDIPASLAAEAEGRGVQAEPSVVELSAEAAERAARAAARALAPVVRALAALVERLQAVEAAKREVAAERAREAAEERLRASAREAARRVEPVVDNTLVAAVAKMNERKLARGRDGGMGR